VKERESAFLNKAKKQTTDNRLMSEETKPGNTGRATNEAEPAGTKSLQKNKKKKDMPGSLLGRELKKEARSDSEKNARGETRPTCDRYSLEDPPEKKGLISSSLANSRVYTKWGYSTTGIPVLKNAYLVIIKFSEGVLFHSPNLAWAISVQLQENPRGEARRTAFVVDRVDLEKPIPPLG